jgi:hypothetical protein
MIGHDVKQCLPQRTPFDGSGDRGFFAKSCLRARLWGGSAYLLPRFFLKISVSDIGRSILGLVCSCVRRSATYFADERLDRQFVAA